jgi:membrane dipeptidase
MEGNSANHKAKKSIADVHKLTDLLTRRGYSSSDLDAIFHGNWLRKFREALPAE